MKTFNMEAMKRFNSEYVRQGCNMEFYLWNCEKQSVRFNDKNYERGKQHVRRTLAYLFLAHHLEIYDHESIETTEQFVERVNRFNEDQWRTRIMEIVERCGTDQTDITNQPHRFDDILNIDIDPKSFQQFVDTFEDFKWNAPLWKQKKERKHMPEVGAGTIMRGLRNELFDRTVRFSGYSSVSSESQRDPTEEHRYPINMTAEVLLQRILDDEIDFTDFLFEWFEKYGVVHHTSGSENDRLVPFQNIRVWRDLEQFHPMIPYAMARVRVFDDHGNQPTLDESFLRSLDYFEIADREDFRIYDDQLAVYDPSFDLNLPSDYHENPHYETSQHMINFIGFIEDNFEPDPNTKMATKDLRGLYQKYLGRHAASDSTLWSLFGSFDRFDSTSVSRVDYDLESSAYSGLWLREDSVVSLNRDRPIHFNYKSGSPTTVETSEPSVENNESDQNLEIALNTIFDAHKGEFIPTQELLKKLYSIQEATDFIRYSFEPPRSVRSLGTLLSSRKDNLNIESDRRYVEEGRLSGWIRK